MKFDIVNIVEFFRKDNHNGLYAIRNYENQQKKTITHFDYDYGIYFRRRQTPSSG